jgi:Uma2 family endonuclease
MTLAEWAELDEDEPGELVDGNLVEEEDVAFAHEVAAGWAIRTLGNWAVPRGGLVGASDGRFRPTARRGRRPDAFVYLAGSPRPAPRDKLLAVPPDIMVEVVSPSPKDAKRDRVDKANEYAAFGVRFYWIVDPWLRTIEILELGQDGRYVRALAVADGKVEVVPGCEGLTLDVDALWAEAGVAEPEEAAAPLPTDAPEPREP